VRYRVLQCPGEYGAHILDWPTADAIYMYEHPCTPLSYAITLAMDYGTGYNGTTAKLGRHTSDIVTGISGANLVRRVPNASDVSFVMDCTVWSSGGWAQAEFGWGIDTFPFFWGPTAPSASYYAFRHGGNRRANMLYYDGHVGSVRPYQETAINLWNYKYP
jgi:prepilin-type processing-associated H-X9-DG protein